MTILNNKHSLILLFSLLQMTAFGQSDSTAQDLSGFRLFYVFDKVWSGGSRRRTDVEPNVLNFLQVQDADGISIWNIANSKNFVKGTIDDVSIVVDENGTFIKFKFNQTKESVTVFVEIEEKTNGEIIIHFYKKLGDLDQFFLAHRANETEINKIQKELK